MRHQERPHEPEQAAVRVILPGGAETDYVDLDGPLYEAFVQIARRIAREELEAYRASGGGVPSP